MLYIPHGVHIINKFLLKKKSKTFIFKLTLLHAADVRLLKS